MEYIYSVTKNKENQSTNPKTIYRVHKLGQNNSRITITQIL